MKLLKLYARFNIFSKYIVLDSTEVHSTEENKVLKMYTEIWDGIKNCIETIKGGKKGEYG